MEITQNMLARKIMGTHPLLLLLIMQGRNVKSY